MKTFKNSIRTGIIFIAIVAGMSSCDEEAFVYQYEVKAPVITDFSPKTGNVGTLVTITGENLQRVDTVKIGGEMAHIKYRISASKLVAEVKSTCKTGPIYIRNTAGNATSTEDFTMTYPIPSVSSYPSSGLVFSQVVLEGENLNVIDSVFVGGVNASIISKRTDEIVFIVPYSDVEANVKIELKYFDGTSYVSIGTDGETFEVLKPSPVINSCPTSLTKYTPITIEGERLNLIDSIFVGTVKLTIKSKTETSIVVDLPTNYFTDSYTANLVGHYYGVKQLLIQENFNVYSDPNEPRYYTYTNVLLSALIGYGGTENAFFDAETGTVYHSCDAHDNRLSIDFYLYNQAGYVQLYGPHNGSSTVKNYKCNGSTIDPADVDWSDFYGVSGITTKFRMLSPDSANHVAVINAYNSGTIVELNDAFFAGITPPATSAPRIYKNYNKINGIVGAKTADSLNVIKSYMSLDYNNLSYVKNYNTGKRGIVKVVSMPQDAVNGRIPDLIIDIIWEK